MLAKDYFYVAQIQGAAKSYEMYVKIENSKAIFEYFAYEFDGKKWQRIVRECASCPVYDYLRTLLVSAINNEDELKKVIRKFKPISTLFLPFLDLLSALPCWKAFVLPVEEIDNFWPSKDWIKG